jgi:hypothetical protein
VIGKSITHAGPGIDVTSAKFYPTYRIMSFHAVRNGNQYDCSDPICLDAFGGEGTAGTPVGAYGCDPNFDHQTNQLWLRVPDPTNPNVYSFANLDGVNRTGYVNLAPRLSVENDFDHPAQSDVATL